MKAVQFVKPHVLQVIDKPLRTLRENEVLVKVEACGICGTDVHIVEGTSRSTPPVVLGHEYAGVVEEAGSLVHGVQVGQRVAVDPNISCGTCYFCSRGQVHLCSNLRALGVDIDGGMAQFCIVPQSQIYTLPSEMTPEISAFVEPVSCAIHGIDLAKIRIGDSIVILGGGTIGLIMLQLTRRAGASRIIVVEQLEHKRALATQLGADAVINPEESDLATEVLDLTRVGADVVIECAGSIQTARAAIGLARRGGLVEFFGVCPVHTSFPLVPHEVYFRELTIVGSYVNPHTFARAIDVLRSGSVRVDLFQIDTFPLDSVHEALAILREGKTIKSVLLPQA